MPETKVLNVGGGSFNKKCEEVIDDDEKELYDRQIRLWGLDAQNRLRNSSVLLAGLSGCGAEVAKNLMLAGVSSLTLLDHSEVTKDDEYCQFMIPLESVGKNRAECSKERCQSLNPRVKLIVDKSDVSEKADDFFLQFDLVILTNQKYSVIERVDNICRKANIKFEAGGVYGWIGYGFFDFNNHHFLIKSQKVQHAVLDMDEETIENIQNGGPSSSKRMRKDDDTSFSSLPNGSQKLIADIDLSEDDDVRVKKVSELAF
ncbi:hypothetical protein AB6A40_004550 [Gnathostoma spinigerum]|uniref:THIF-type NAD/FAD binding fold domain-containing protein n=1 Tax=Gnathostoma spinigerum TaxID=75299 RepID=A0ABD6EDX1_9BILA